VLTSASSKTAYGLAHLLRERPVRTVGLTSPPRREWVEGLGVYDAVLTYRDAGALTVDGGVVVVDFAGDLELVRAVHDRLRGAVTRSVAVGFTHGREVGERAPEQEFFFAPDEIMRRGNEFRHGYAEAWRSFAPFAARALRIEHIGDGDALVRAYRTLLAGDADPATAYVVSL
jgi:hypothetical protein